MLLLHQRPEIPKPLNMTLLLTLKPRLPVQCGRRCEQDEGVRGGYQCEPGQAADARPVFQVRAAS